MEATNWKSPWFRIRADRGCGWDRSFIFISYKFRPFGKGPVTPRIGDFQSPWSLTTYPSECWPILPSFTLPNSQDRTWNFRFKIHKKMIRRYGSLLKYTLGIWKFKKLCTPPQSPLDASFPSEFSYHLMNFIAGKLRLSNEKRARCYFAVYREWAL